MTYQKKIILAAVLWASISGVVGFFVLKNVKELIQLQTKTTEIHSIVQDFQGLLTIIVDMETGIRGYLLSGDDNYLQPFSAAEGLFDGEAKKLTDKLQEGSSVKANLQSVIDIKAAWISGPIMEEMMARRKLSRNMIKNEEFLTIFKASKGKQNTDEIRAKIKETIEPLNLEAHQLSENLVKMANETLLTTAVGIVLGILFGFITLLVISRKASREIDKIISILSQVSDEIFATSQRIAQTSTTLTGSTHKVSSAVNQTSTAVEEIYQTTSKTSEDAESSKVLLSDCLDATRLGKQSVEETIVAMKEIEEQNHTLQKMIDSNNKDMKKIVDLVKSISVKTQVINDIVFQTKLLSFNASVESARAGEHGKGFSVVAEEIGSLATMSGGASKEIFEIVDVTIKDIEGLVLKLESESHKKMLAFSEKIEDSITKTKASELSLNEIKDKVESFSNYMGNLLQATQEQTKGLSYIRDAVQEVDISVKVNDESSKESLEISNTLEGHVNTLSSTVDELGKLFLNQKNVNH